MIDKLKETINFPLSDLVSTSKDIPIPKVAIAIAVGFIIFLIMKLMFKLGKEKIGSIAVSLLFAIIFAISTLYLL